MESLTETRPYVEAMVLRTKMAETAGMFWIAAELAILFIVLVGRRHLETEPLPDSVKLTFRDKMRAASWLVLAALAVIAVRATDSVPSQADVLGYARLHLVIWVVCVLIWVLLEMLIVYNGWRGYLRLRSLLGKTSLAIPPRYFSMIAVVLTATIVSVPAVNVFAQPALQLEAEIAPYQNAVYLCLRLAGVAWIAVEWVAAIIVWRTYTLIAAAARETRSAHG